jgi:hypothetical protein
MYSNVNNEDVSIDIITNIINHFIFIYLKKRFIPTLQKIYSNVVGQFLQFNISGSTRPDLDVPLEDIQYCQQLFNRYFISQVLLSFL